MQGSPKVIEALNDLLTLELTVVNQYFVHSRMCVNWGYGRIAGQQRAIAMDEMRDAEQIIDRILFLDGVPNMQRLGSVTVGETVSEQFQIALEGEHRALELLHSGIGIALEEERLGEPRVLRGQVARRGGPRGLRRDPTGLDPAIG